MDQYQSNTSRSLLGLDSGVRDEVLNETFQDQELNKLEHQMFIELNNSMIEPISNMSKTATMRQTLPMAQTVKVVSTNAEVNDDHLKCQICKVEYDS